MIGLLMGFGLGKRAAQLVAYVAIPLLILAAFYFTLDAYGDSRFREGRAAENKAWIDAQDKLLKDAAAAASAADQTALAAQMDQAVKVAQEKERVDDAIANGSSPFDVLFGTDGVHPGQGGATPPNAP